jgi:uncharacterized protein with HEPN domain
MKLQIKGFYSMTTKDYKLLVHIIDFCLEINQTIHDLEYSKDNFLKNKDYQKSIIFTIIQIGELANRFSSDFLSETSGEFPWSGLMKARDKYVNGFLTINYNLVWHTAIQDIPVIAAFCKEKISEYDLINDNQMAIISKIKP